MALIGVSINRRPSEAELATVNPFLQQLIRAAAKDWDITVLEGVRTLERQKKLVLSGASKTLESRHLVGSDGYSAAVDVSPRGYLIPIDWKDTPLFYYFGGYVVHLAKTLNIPLRWGGDWDMDHQVKDQDFNDLVHFELLK